MVIVKLQKLEKIKIFIDFLLYKAQMVQNQKVNIYVQSTPTFARVYTGTRVSYSKCLQSKIVHVMFSCKNSLIRGKLHTLFPLGKKDVKGKRDPRLWFFSKEKCFIG